jgi:hypothetical protein
VGGVKFSEIVEDGVRSSDGTVLRAEPRAPTTTLIGYSLSINAYYPTRRARGLFRHYWVLISLLLTIIATVVLLVETQTICYFADRAADPTTSGHDLRTLGNTPSTLLVARWCCS